MTQEILFSESQRFRQWWLWLIILGVSGLVIFELIQQPGGKSNASLLTACSIVTLVNLLILSIRLDTVIKPDGLYIRFFPFQRRFRYFSWDNVGQIHLRQYSPIGEYGGWGFRIGIGTGKAYTISGNKGIQLVLNDGSKLLIGTNRYEEVERVLEKLNK